MYTINSCRNNLIILPFLWQILHYKHLWWANVRWEFVLLSITPEHCGLPLKFAPRRLIIFTEILRFSHTLFGITLLRNSYGEPKAQISKKENYSTLVILLQGLLRPAMQSCSTVKFYRPREAAKKVLF